MDLNKTYQINIISQAAKGRGLFLVVERFNDHASHHFQNYYRKLRNFNQCYEWFQKLDYPTLQVGSVILAKINKRANSWSRGIISKLNIVDGYTLKSQLYLIDTQRIVNSNSCMEFRFIPPKFANLVLPTYSIYIDFGLDDDGLLQSAIEMLIAKNQCGDISFNFIPQSITRDNIYLGELNVNYEIDNSIITLENFIKNVYKKKKLNDPDRKQCEYTIFDPLSQSISSQNIFVPKNFRKNLYSGPNQTSSFSELNHSNGSLESDESSSLDNSEYFSFSDDTANKTTTHNNCDTTEKSNSSLYFFEDNGNLSIDASEKTQSECSVTINSSSSKISVNQNTQQNPNSSLNFDDESKLNLMISTATTTNVSENIISSDYFEKTHTKCTETIKLNTEQNQNSSVDVDDQSKLNSVVSTSTTENMNSTSSDNNDTNVHTPKTMLELKPNGSVNNQEINVDTSNDWKKLMRNRSEKLKSSRKKNNDPIICTQNIKETPKKQLKKLFDYDDGTVLWWTDESD